MPHPRRLTALLLAAVTGFALSAPPAIAHTEVVSTTPKAGSYAKRSLETVRVRFNQPIRSGRLQVLRAGEQVSSGSGARSSSDVRVIETKLPEELAGGTYVARWTMTAVDGHTQRGSWRFKVRPRPARAEATPTATPTPTASAEPSPSAVPQATVEPLAAADDGEVSTVVLAAGAALVVLFVVGGAVIARRRG